jgi:integrase/recombinase XerD
VRLESGAGLVDGFLYWLETRYPRRIAQVTAQNYYSQAKQWVSWCEENELDFKTATQDDMAIYLGVLRRTMAQHTVKHRLIAMKILYDYAVEKEYCPTNPARCLPTPRAEGRPSEEFTQQELRRMYDACKDHRERAVFLLLLGGGLRRSEVFGIKRDDVNFEQGTVTVLGKGAQYRIIAPGAMAMDALCKALEFDDRLCPFRWNIYVEKLVKRLGDRAGIKGRVHPHRFRAHFASAFLEAGGAVDELQQILGHSRLDMSVYYARASKRRRALQSQQRIDVAARMLSGEPREGPVALREAHTA